MTTVDIVLTGKRHEYYDDSSLCRSRIVQLVLQVTSRIVQLVLRVTSHIVQLFCRSRLVSYSLLREPRLVTVQVTSCIVQLVLRVTSGLVQLPVQCRCLCPPVKAAVKQCHVTHLLHV